MNRATKHHFNGDLLVGDDGEPLVFYHGHSGVEFDRFKYGELGSGSSEKAFAGLSFGWFTDDEKQAHKFGEKVIAVYIYLKNPLILRAEGTEQIPFISDRKRLHFLDSRFDSATGLNLIEAEERRILIKRHGVRCRETMTLNTSAEPFAQLESLAEEARFEYLGLGEGPAVRKSLEEQGFDSIILEGTIADTSPGDSTPHTWVIPLSSPNQVVTRRFAA